LDLYRKSAAAAGRSSQVILMRDAWVSPRREEADEVFLSEAIRELLFYFRFGIVAHHPDFKTEADFTPDRMRKHYVTGTPEECIRQLEMFQREFGADYFVLRFRFPQGPAAKKVLEAVRLFGKEVLPHFR
jgi:alkanesulfonate monooxygenase SsuD/methylene tetrahydromethanopterin reductase-like flavin-dependent oxidoreductase (luciferase family)